MTAHWAAIAIPFCLLISIIFVAMRLRLFSDPQVAGRYPYLGGAALVLLAATWHAVATTPGYERWFVITAYRTLDTLEFVTLLCGLGLLVFAIYQYAERQRHNREELRVLEGKLSIQENLQQEARSHYQLLELLSITLKELLMHFPGSAGAAFLVNRGKGQLVLGAGMGLTRNETAGLEQYPLGRNMITHAIEDGAPTIAGGFEFVDSQGRASESRFESSLVLPLVSGGEKIGAILLLAEPARIFGRLDVRYLLPVAQWLAERILATRLNRDLGMVRTQLESVTRESDTGLQRIRALLQDWSSPDIETSICRGLLGLHGATSVYVCSLQAGRFQMASGVGQLEEISETLRTALIDAVDRRKPLVINQEATDDNGRSIVVRSNLMVPMPTEAFAQSLLLRKDGAPFDIGDRELQTLTLLAQIVRAALSQSDMIRRDLKRRSGFDRIIALLSGTIESQSPDATFDFFLNQIREVIPKSGLALAFRRHEDASFALAGDYHGTGTASKELAVAAGEGVVAAVAASQEPYFAVGKKSVLAALETFHPENVRVLNTLFDEHQLPGFAGFCPIIRSDAVVGVVALFLPSSAPDESAEWERLMTLACGLYSLRLTVEDVRGTRDSSLPTDRHPSGTSSLINDVNNHLSAVIGTAGLALRMEQLSGDMRTELSSIIAEAEKAAGLLKRATVAVAAESDKPAETVDSSNDINSSIDRVLQAARISGDLYMAGGRAREILKRLGQVESVTLATPVLSQFFESVLDRFAAAVSDDDMMTISTYEKDGYVFLDISRHRRNFPPVDHVSSFGDYELADSAARTRPADIFLSHIAAESCYYAYDRISSTPAYLSFKFPVKRDHAHESGSATGTGMKILAIDDQAVILDLITAMCQSMGFQVETAGTGEEGLKLAAKDRFDLVLTDLAMPDISGLEVARRIHRQNPETTIVLITGWEAGFEPGQIQSTGISQVLYKPFRIEQLADIIKTTAGRLAI